MQNHDTPTDELSRTKDALTLCTARGDAATRIDVKRRKRVVEKFKREKVTRQLKGEQSQRAMLQRSQETGSSVHVVASAASFPPCRVGFPMLSFDANIPNKIPESHQLSAK